jgi:predicted phage gp36 major capsid-like protein
VPIVFGANQRPTAQSGWFAYKRVGADVLTSNAFKTLKL